SFSELSLSSTDDKGQRQKGEPWFHSLSPCCRMSGAHIGCGNKSDHSHACSNVAKAQYNYTLFYSSHIITVV
ncbi:hypothetical protein OFN54_37330, partial [Escherichia coli]|nr:hypothetical protein [Escherichia coli]